MLKRILILAYRLLWHGFAIIVLAAAVLVTALRLMLPGIGDYKDEIQALVSDYTGYPVTIEGVGAEWAGWAPSLFLDGIAFYDRPGGAPAGRFERVAVTLDPLASLAAWRPVPSRLSVRGLALDLTRGRDGRITVRRGGRDNPAAAADGGLAAWLLQQQYIVLDEARLSFHDEQSGWPPLLLTNTRIALKTAGQRIRIEGTTELAAGGRLLFRLDAEGDLLTRDWQGDIYIEAGAVSPAGLGPGLPLAGGAADLRLWSRWAQAGPQDFQAELTYRDFKLIHNDHALPVMEAALTLHGAREPGGWLINANTRALQTRGGRWPAGHYQLAVENGAGGQRYQLYASYLKLAETLPFLAAAGLLDAGVMQRLDPTALAGALRDIHLHLSTEPGGAGLRHLSGQFQGLDISSQDRRYRAENLAGAFAVQRQQLRVRLKGPEATLSLGPLYEQPLALTNIDSALELDYGAQPELKISAARAGINGLPVRATGRVRLAQDSPFIDLLARAGPLAIDRLPAFLPGQIAPELKQWLGQALAGGRLNSADMLLRGRLADFPFKNNAGNFKAIFNLSDTSLEYDPLWPPIDNTDIALTFANQAVHATLHNGYIFDARIGKVKLALPDITAAEKSVLAEADMAGSARDLRAFIDQSPLGEDPWLDDIKDKLAGAIKLDVRLDIPLSEALAAIDGRAVLTDVAFASGSGFDLEAIQGELGFSREQIWGADIDAVYHGLPVKLSIPRETEAGALQFILSGRAGGDFIADELALLFPDEAQPAGFVRRHLTGQSQWQLTLHSARDAAGQTRDSLAISSDLEGARIDLPAPLGKAASERRPLLIQARLPDSGVEKIDIRYADTLFAELLMAVGEAAEITRINIGLGREAAPLDSDISLQGELDEFDLSAWRRILARIDWPAGGRDYHLAARLDTKRLKMFNRAFNQARIDLNRPGRDWLIDLAGPDIAGKIRFSEAEGRGQGRLQADLDRLALHAGEDDAAPALIRALPELEINIADMLHNGNPLGRVTLTTTNSDHGVNIDRLGLSRPGLDIEASGRWAFGAGRERTDFSAVLEADSIGALFETFGYAGASIEGGQTRLTLAANWADAPMRFALEKLAGRLELEIDKGQFLAIDPALGRLFGLLNLQTLPRRLTLDFSDLFDRGFAFDTIQGGFSLQQGHAYTNDLRMRGPAADIMISGRTGIISEDYDQIATVMPRLSSSLPAAGALFGPVGIGVGAMIYLTGELFDETPVSINRILSYQYRITGSWDDPDIKEITEPPTAGG